MSGRWLEDIESLEAISQDVSTRRLCLRLGHVVRSGGLQPFLRELAATGDLDDETKVTVAELAYDPMFLHAVDDYLHRTRRLH